jgi:GNAT superfamily N-acetyltransferase
MLIRLARPIESEALSKLAVEARSHWGHDVHDLAALPESVALDWRLFDKRPTYVAELEGEVAGFYQVRFDEGRPLLDHFWVRPADAAAGVGRQLLAHALHEAERRGHDRLHIDAEPHAERFFLGCGAMREGEKPAPITGQPDRVRPQLVLRVGSL